MRPFFFFLLFFPAFLRAQDNQDYLGKINISVVRDEQQTEPILFNQITKIESKILSLITKYGISGQGYGANFILTPRLEIYDEDIVEGMQNIVVITVELNLFIKQSSSGIVFSAFNKQLKGTGNSRDAAITNAISQIKPSDPDAGIFIETAKKKIIDYYNSKCSEILSEADKYASVNDFDKALALLMSVPVEATACNEKIKIKSIEIFKKRQQKDCQSQILSAKSNIAGNNFWDALEILALIDPTSSCFKEANTLISQTENKLDLQEKAEWSRQREMYKDQIALEKLQIQAIRDASLAYYKRTSSNVIWNFLR